MQARDKKDCNWRDAPRESFADKAADFVVKTAAAAAITVVVTAALGPVAGAIAGAVVAGPDSILG